MGGGGVLGGLCGGEGEVLGGQCVGGGVGLVVLARQDHHLSVRKGPSLCPSRLEELLQTSGVTKASFK